MENWDLDGSSQRLPISAVTGFLGSGKTIALNCLIQQPTLSRTLVLINEFREIGLDHEAIRFALLGAQYRQPLDWSTDGHAQARCGLDRLYGVLRELGDAPDKACPPGRLDAFETALEDDLKFPGAIAELFQIAKAARQATTMADRADYNAALRGAGELLGLQQQDPTSWFKRSAEEGKDTEAIERLLGAWLTVRAARDCLTADRIRDELEDLGVTVEDRADGPAWPRTDSPMSPCLRRLRAMSAVVSGSVEVAAHVISLPRGVVPGSET